MSTVFDVENKQNKLAELKQNLETVDYADLARIKQINQEIKKLNLILSEYETIKTRIDALKDFMSFAEENDDEEFLVELGKELTYVAGMVDALYYETLLKGEYDFNNAIVKIHSGAGGTEACDWAQMLFRMYSMFADHNGYKLVVVDSLDGDEAGLKSITFRVEGDNAYGYLKGEIGVHRLVRISPFDSNKRRHTSFASVEVMPELDESYHIVIRDEDIRIDTYRASGAGGQHVNKTDSAIRITHFPTNTVVTCQNERSQLKNRETAMNLLKSKLVALKEEENRQHALSIKGESKKIEWGSQIRSYVFCPYTKVIDHRTEFETSNVEAVMNGDIKEFLLAYLKWIG